MCGKHSLSFFFSFSLSPSISLLCSWSPPRPIASSRPFTSPSFRCIIFSLRSCIGAGHHSFFIYCICAEHLSIFLRRAFPQLSFTREVELPLSIHTEELPPGVDHLQHAFFSSDLPPPRSRLLRSRRSLPRTGPKAQLQSRAGSKPPFQAVIGPQTGSWRWAKSARQSIQEIWHAPPGGPGCHHRQCGRGFFSSWVSY